MQTPPSLDQIQTAAERIRPFVHRTPVLTCRSIDSLLKATLFFKCENFQKVGAFKFRGASNAVFSLGEAEAAKGVATHSSGNHAAAVALAARLRGIPSYIVMPRTAPQVKKRAVEGYGAEITLCEPTEQARGEALASVVARTGAAFIHPYDNYAVIAGQATAALELLKEVPDLDAILTPVGGGGLLSGTALTTAYISPRTQVFAGEPLAADDAFRSMQTGTLQPSVNPQTVADGLLTSLGALTFPIIRQHVQRIITVTEEEILAAMRLVWERMKIVIEPSAAVPLAAVSRDKAEFSGKKVGVILSGGNLDLAQFFESMAG